MFVLSATRVEAQGGQASIYLSPNKGTFQSGGTFDISIFVNTGGQSINAVRLDLSFPTDQLQVVDPTGGNSFISIWITQPEYSNVKGTVSLQGGLPSPGINTTNGLITTITFRAKTPGTAVITVMDSSRVLANDGQGTDLLSSFGTGYYTIVFPSLEGPIIVSSTHDDQNKWYRNNNPRFSWTLENPEVAEGDFDWTSILGTTTVDYSWIFDKDALDIPDNEVDGQETSTAYEDVESGIWIFHIKARVLDVWGETSHYLVRIDNVPPAAFDPVVDPVYGGEDIRPLISFVTTDQHSGIDHYEVRVESVNEPDEGNASFVEASSPWQAPLLPKGVYRVIVRAYDKAGNWYDGQATFEIHKDLVTAIREHGLRIGPCLIPIWLAIVLPLILLLVFILLLRVLRRKFADPSSQLSEYLGGIRQRQRKRKQKLAKEISEEKEIQDILTKELNNNLQKKKTPEVKKAIEEKGKDKNNPNSSNKISL